MMRATLKSLLDGRDPGAVEPAAGCVEGAGVASATGVVSADGARVIGSDGKVVTAGVAVDQGARLNVLAATAHE